MIGSWRFSLCSAPIHCHMNLYLRRRKEKTSEASVKHAGLEGGVCERSEQEKFFSVPRPPTKSSLLFCAGVQFSHDSPHTFLNRGL